MNQPPTGVDAEYEVQGQVRPCLGVIEVPVSAIDGAAAIGVALQVRGKGDGFVVLAIGDKNVQVRADQLETALQSLALLVRANVPPLQFGVADGASFPFPFEPPPIGGMHVPGPFRRGPRPVP